MEVMTTTKPYVAEGNDWMLNDPDVLNFFGPPKFNTVKPYHNTNSKMTPAMIEKKMMEDVDFVPCVVDPSTITSLSTLLQNIVIPIADAASQATPVAPQNPKSSYESCCFTRSTSSETALVPLTSSSKVDAAPYSSRIHYSHCHYDDPFNNYLESVLGNGAPPVGTYHPLLVEAWFVMALNYLIVGEWSTGYQWHDRLAGLESHVDGYPVFLQARSMGQADYFETLKHLIRFNKNERRIQSAMQRQQDLVELQVKLATTVSLKEVEEEGERDSPIVAAAAESLNCTSVNTATTTTSSSKTENKENKNKKPFFLKNPSLPSELVGAAGSNRFDKQIVKRSFTPPASNPRIFSTSLGDQVFGKQDQGKYSLHTKRVDLMLVKLEWGFGYIF